MAVSRAERRALRRARVEVEFGAADASTVLDLLEIVELAWHDCYDEVTPPDGVVDDLFVMSGGDLRQLVMAARIGLTDYRDLRVAADRRRASS